MSANTLTVEQAGNQLPELMKMVAQGEEVVILQADRPAARLVPIVDFRGPKRFGQYRGRIQIADDFDDC
jgi:prevent-host-death family protein